MSSDSVILNKEIGCVVTFRLFVCVGGVGDRSGGDKVLTYQGITKRENFYIFYYGEITEIKTYDRCMLLLLLLLLLSSSSLLLLLTQPISSLTHFLLRVHSLSFAVSSYSVIPILYICHPNLFLKIVTSCWLSYSCRYFFSLWESQSVHTFR